MMMAPEQWLWLEAELTNSSAAAHLIVSSVQVLTSSPLVESWGHFPLERARLLDLLARTRPAAAVLLSGDVHFAELIGSASRRGATDATDVPSRLRGVSTVVAGAEEGWDVSAGGTEPAALLEVTSSGLTHSCGTSLMGRLSCNAVLRLFPAHRLVQAGMTAHDGGWGARRVGSSYMGLNFGTIRFAWEGGTEGGRDAAESSTVAGARR